MEKNRHTDATAAAAAASTANRSDLQTAKQLFDLIHHRNKNQHRHSLWWRQFAVLRRAVGKLVQELEREEQWGDKRNDRGGKACARARFLEEHLIPKCYLSFTQLIHDNQFSALGLVLLATLARVRRACSDILAASSPPSVPAVTDPATAAPRLGHQATGAERLGAGEDTGEVVTRTEPGVTVSASRTQDRSLLSGQTEKEAEEVVVDDDDMVRSERTPTKAQAPASAPAAASAAKAARGSRKDRRRQRSNPIDALFRGLA